MIHIAGKIGAIQPENPARDLIDRTFVEAMEEKGFILGNPADGVDFFVDCHLLFKQTVYLLAERGQGGSGEWMRVVRIPEKTLRGALILEVSDARTGNLVWQGVWNADITTDEVSDEHKEQRIAYAVQQLLKTFPPQ